jgi:hypothetical protein
LFRRQFSEETFAALVELLDYAHYVVETVLIREMRDEDGGLLFCYSKRLTTGLVLTFDQIQSWISSETQKKKVKQKDPKTGNEKTEENLIQELNTGQAI